MKKFLKRWLPEVLKAKLRQPRRLAPYAGETYSQEGEDQILRRIFHGRPIGFYVDVGAYHPQELSNTFTFYLKGWRGINMDPVPGGMREFNKVRPRDINLEVAVSEVAGSLTYHQFDPATVNTFSEEVARQRVEYGDGPNSDFKYRLIGQIKVEALPLATILGRHLPPGQRIDLLNIDVEGHEMAVLASNDWTKYRPLVVAIEDSSLLGLDELPDSAVAKFLTERGYAPFCRTPLTLIFVLRDQLVGTPQGPRLRAIA